MHERLTPHRLPGDSRSIWEIQIEDMEILDVAMPYSRQEVIIGHGTCILVQCHRMRPHHIRLNTVCKYTDENTILYATKSILTQWPNSIYWRQWLVQEIEKIDVSATKTYLDTLPRTHKMTACSCINRECHENHLDQVCRLAKANQAKDKYDEPPYIINGAIKVFIDRYGGPDLRDWKSLFINEIYDMRIQGSPMLRTALLAREKEIEEFAKTLPHALFTQASSISAYNSPSSGGLKGLWQRLNSRRKGAQKHKLNGLQPISLRDENWLSDPLHRQTRKERHFMEHGFGAPTHWPSGPHHPGVYRPPPLTPEQEEAKEKRRMKKKKEEALNAHLTMTSVVNTMMHH